MERFELEEELKEEIRRGVLGAGFMKIVQTVRRNGKTFRIAIRPVEIGGERKYQAEMTDEGRVTVKNFGADAIADGLEEIIAQRGARDLHLMTAKGDLHVRVTRRGKAHVSRSAAMDRSVETRGNDRVKNVPLNQFDSAALLRVIGLTDGSGQIRASMRGKYDQVNEFLKVVGETVSAAAPVDAKSGRVEKEGESSSSDAAETSASTGDAAETSASTGDAAETSASTGDAARTPRLRFTAVDCGCGKAYLTISLYFYLTQVLGYADVRVIGIDRRADVIAAARKMAEALDVADRVRFVEADLTDFGAELIDANFCSRQNEDDDSAFGRDQKIASTVDLVCSLHACDTATDEALAKGVEWKARYILSAPCCQHELQKTISPASSAAFAGLLRQGILRERLCDILTDAFRAMILRILGFKVQVIEFVSSEATARNIMLKCEYGVKPGQPGPVGEYLELRDYWKVVPWLETRLAERLKPHLQRFS